MLTFYFRYDKLLTTLETGKFVTGRDKKWWILLYWAYYSIMADTRLTKVGFVRATYLCLLAIFQPEKLVKEENKDNKEQKNFPQPPPPSERRAFVIRQAFWSSLLLIIASGAFGYIVGHVIDKWLGFVPKIVITSLQIIGAMLLLWGTLFVRGWEIQSFGGVTLFERVNKWIYRTLCCTGTIIIISSLALSSCSQQDRHDDSPVTYESAKKTLSVGR
jgi:hypothetical protein